MKNQDKFCELFHSYLRPCKISVERFSDTGPAIKFQLDQCKSNSSGRFYFSKPLVIDYEQAAYLAFMDNKNTLEYMDLTSYLTEHKVIGKSFCKTTFADFGVPSTSVARLLSNLLNEYLIRNKSFNINKRLALNLYKSILTFYSRTRLEAIVTCYLENVGIGGKLFKISDNIHIRSLSSKDVEILYNRNDCFREFYSGTWTRDNNLKYVMGVLRVHFSSKIAYESDKILSHYDVRFRGQQFVEHVLTALRLYTFGDVNASPITVQILELPFQNVEKPWGDNYFRQPKFPDIIEPHLYRHIRKTFHDVVTFSKYHPDPDLLFNRLRATSHRNSDEDILVDSCIAMETLVKSFLVKNSGFNMTSRDMAIHMAHLLDTNSTRRKKVFDIVINGFKLRNMIVHGDRMKLRTRDPLTKFFSVLREAIKKVVAQSPNIKKRDIEDLVL